MLIYSLCLAIAIIWLCIRLYKFLSISVFNIVSTLNIKTPPATKVSIDKISMNSITIHWENEPLTENPKTDSESDTETESDSISHFLLYLNNSQIAVFPNIPDLSLIHI